MSSAYFAQDFYRAAYRGNIEELERLIKEGMDVNFQSGIVGWDHIAGLTGPTPFNVGSALHFAAMGGKENAVRFLVDRGADVNIRDDFGSTPLCRAFNYSNGISKFLIESGADVNVPDRWYGHLFLSFIATHYNTELLKLLIAKGIDLNVQCTRDGNNALTYMVESDLRYRRGISVKNLEYIKILIESGANPCISNNEGKSLVDYLYTLPEDLQALVEDKLKNRSKMCKGAKV